MTYMARRTIPRRTIPRRRRGLGDLLDDVNQKYDRMCLDKANADMAPFDAKIDDMVKTWKPTGFYTPQDLRTIVQQTLTVTNQAYDALTQVAQDVTGGDDSIARAISDLGTAGQRSLDYLGAATQAEQAGLRLVNAPGLKRWVTDTLATTSSAMVTASVVACQSPWWLNALSAYQTVFDKAKAVVVRIVGAVLAIGETALKVADDLPKLYDILKWGALGLGGYWLWVNHLRHHFPRDREP